MTLKKITNSESAAGEGGGREKDLLKKTSRCYAKGTWGFYFASDIDIKAIGGFGEQE